MGWYTGRPVDPPYRPSFIQGAWWTADLAALKEWNYPFPELHHNGGDVILGELARQQLWSWKKFNEGVAINANEHGVESAAPRRGITTPVIWSQWQPGETPSLVHQDFEVQVVTLPPVAREAR